MFQNIRDEITRNIRELKIWTSCLGENEDFYVISRGLFFVYAYGIYEEVIRKVISATIHELNCANVTIDKCIYELYDLIFSKEYDALYHVGSEHKWDKRWQISEKLQQNPLMSIDANTFPTDGKNLRYRQLNSLATSFGIRGSVLPRSEIGGYITELVDNRNDIAHGNKTPKEVGRNYTKDNLLDRCDYVSEVCIYIADSYEKYITEKNYLR